LRPVGVASLRGSLRCVERLLDEDLTDGGDKDLVTLAVVGGHMDVLRAVVGVVSGAEINGGFSVAIGLCDVPMMMFLRQRGGKPVWSRNVREVLMRIAGKETLTGVLLASEKRWTTLDFLEGIAQLVRQGEVRGRCRADPEIGAKLRLLDGRIRELWEAGGR
jgi:hypothetical protein